MTIIELVSSFKSLFAPPGRWHSNAVRFSKIKKWMQGKEDAWQITYLYHPFILTGIHKQSHSTIKENEYLKFLPLSIQKPSILIWQN